jgi:hypothetical protein
MWTLAFALAAGAGAQTIDAKNALQTLGFPADAEAKVLAGEFVQRSLPAASERDLNVGIAFLVKTTPEKLTQKLREDRVLQRVDPQTIAYGNFEGDGAPAQLARLKLTPAQLKAYAAAGPGDALNLSSEEIAALGAAGKDPAAIERVVHEQLIARYRAYRAKGLAGIAPYARKGSQTDAAGELTGVNRVVRANKVLPAPFYDLLDHYPQSAPADLTEIFYWSQFTAHGEDTITLVHAFQGTFGGNLVAVQRQYYVSTGYNVEQAIVGFLPAEQGTLVLYGNHTSTDQLAGFGSSAKRSIGRQLMADELQKLFTATAAAVTR